MDNLPYALPLGQPILNLKKECHLQSRIFYYASLYQIECLFILIFRYVVKGNKETPPPPTSPSLLRFND